MKKFLSIFATALVLGGVACFFNPVSAMWGEGCPNYVFMATNARDAVKSAYYGTTGEDARRKQESLQILNGIVHHNDYTMNDGRPNPVFGADCQGIADAYERALEIVGMDQEIIDDQIQGIRSSH